MTSIGKIAADGVQRHLAASTAKTGAKAYAIEILNDTTTCSVATETKLTDSAVTIDRVAATNGLSGRTLNKGHLLYPTSGYIFTAFTFDKEVAFYEE